MRRAETPLAVGGDSLLAAIVESSDDAIVSKTLEGVITSWNRAAQRVFGYTPDEAIGRPITMLIPPDRQQDEAIILGRVRSGEAIDHYETVRVTKDGRPIDVSVTISRVRGATGEVEVVRDITLQKQAQRELRDVDLRKNEFLALLAHELRNPLGPIRHAVKILRARAPSPDELQWATGIIERQTEHLTRLLDDLLDVARITRGMVELQRERVDVGAVLRSAVEASNASIARHRHQLTVIQPSRPLYVDADMSRLTQIVTNLLDNAAKHTDPEGRIWLSGEREGDAAVIRVKDTGIGIPADVLPHIFDMFTRSGLSLERAQGGFGVGLALVDQLVKLHGGTVSAHSAGTGQGSEFVIRLPIVRAHNAPMPEQPGPGDVVANRSRVLVVDNADSVDSLAMLLRMTGHVVETANDGESALVQAEEFRPDVAILDIGLPKMNGYELAKQIRELAWAKEIVLVALTGWGQEEHRRRAVESGFNHHLTKPVEFDALQEILAAADSRLPDRNVASR